MKWWGWSVLAVAVTGCATPNGAWEPQLRAARSIGDPRQRADALAAAAEAAGSVGDVATVKSALGDLADDPRHDDVAERCAIQLGNAAYWSAARETALLIRDEGRRKAALVKVGG